MARKLAILAAGVAALALGTYVYLTPHLVLDDMQSAARARHPAALAEHVDFPAVRRSLRGEIQRKLEAGDAESSSNPIRALGSAFAGALLDPILDRLVTPESLALLLRGAKPQRGGSLSGEAPPESAVEIETGYEDTSTFVVSVRTKGDAGEPVRFVLSREGLVAWKLTAVRLP